MGGFSDYLEEEILKHCFGKAGYSAPTIHVALSTEDPGEYGSGLAEPSGNSYARVATSASDWSVAAAGAIANVNAISFAEATGTWGTVTHFALTDAASGGNLLAHGSLSESTSIGSGDTVEFAAGDLTVSLE